MAPANLFYERHVREIRERQAVPGQPADLQDNGRSISPAFVSISPFHAMHVCEQPTGGTGYGGAFRGCGAWQTHGGAAGRERGGAVRPGDDLRFRPPGSPETTALEDPSAERAKETLFKPNGRTRQAVDGRMAALRYNDCKEYPGQ